jgi:hypothetical protein
MNKKQFSLNVFNTPQTASLQDAYAYYKERAHLCDFINEQEKERDQVTGGYRAKHTRAIKKAEAKLQKMTDVFHNLPDALRDPRKYMEDIKRRVDSQRHDHQQRFSGLAETMTDPKEIVYQIKWHYDDLVKAQTLAELWDCIMPEDDSFLDDYLNFLSQFVDDLKSRALREMSSSRNFDAYGLHDHYVNAAHADFVSNGRIQWIIDYANNMWDSFVLYVAFEEAEYDLSFVE